MIEFSLPLEATLSVVIGVVLPLLVGLVSTRTTSARRKAVLLAALAAVAGLGSELLASLRLDEVYDLGVGLLTALSTFLVAVGLHFGLWKPTGTSTAAQDTSLR